MLPAGGAWVSRAKSAPGAFWRATRVLIKSGWPEQRDAGFAGGARMSDQEAAVTQVLADYYNAFSTLDVQAILPCFNEPAVMIGSQGVFAVPTRAALAPIFATVMEDLRQKGYGHSELLTHRTSVLSATAALVSGVALRYKADGEELERVGVTYLLNQADKTWKIAVLVLHDPDRFA
jgi:ketosteroid isomerase-like protein